LLNERQYGSEKRQRCTTVAVTILTDSERRNAFADIMEIVNCQTKLSQVIAALHSPCRFARRLNGRQKQRNQYADNRNHDEKFNEREAKTLTLTDTTFSPSTAGAGDTNQKKQNFREKVLKFSNQIADSLSLSLVTDARSTLTKIIVFSFLCEGLV
jgi:hypothetical protein